MRLEVGGHVRDQGVRRAVRLVKPVARELDDQVPEVLSLAGGQAFGDAARDKLLAVLGDDVFFLFADRFDAGIRRSQLDAAELVQNPHHLLLIDHNAVGLGEDFFANWMDVFGLLASVLHLDVVADHTSFERPWAIEGVRSDDVPEVIGPHLLQKIADAAAFELEDPFCFAALQERKGLLVVERELVRIDLLAGRLLDDLDRFAENGQIPEPEKIHFQKASRLDISHRPLGDDVGLAGDAAERDVFRQRLVGDHNGGGMRPHIAGQPFDFLSEVEHLADVGIARVGLL